jgi:3-dehydroquinate synthetase
MACAFRFSAREGFCPPEAAERVEAHLRAVGLPTRIPQALSEPCDVDDILTAMAQDKKVKRGALTFILARDIGQSFIAKNVDVAKVRVFLEDELRNGD